MRAATRSRAAFLSIAASVCLCSIASGGPADRTPESSIPLGAPRAEAAPQGAKAESGGLDAGWLTTIGSLVLVIGLIAGSAAAVRRVAARSGGLLGAAGAGGRAPAGVLEVLGRYPLGRGSTLLLVKMDRRVLLIGSCAGGRGSATLNTLCEVTDAEEVASLLVKTRDEQDESMSRRFQSLLATQESEARRVLETPDRRAGAAQPRRRVLKDIAA